MLFDFQTITYGKWILAGEHAVVRGHEALVFPIKERQLILSYKTSSIELGADFTGNHGLENRLLFWSVLEKGMTLLGKSFNQVTGYFHLDSNIPVGLGMGASASLCVAMSRWFSEQNWIEKDNIFSLAKELEHLFHGKSSGLDVAGVSSESGLCFKEGKIYPILQTVYPFWYLSSCDQIGITAHCIQKVQDIWASNPTFAQSLDLQMAQSALEAKAAIEKGGSDYLSILATSIHRAEECFKQWGLINPSLEQHMNQLKREGAIAVKPTGSGGGGYVLSLWDSAHKSSFEMIRV